MRNILLVGAGGFLGSIARYLTGGVIYSWVRTPWLPWGTLVVNVLGCLIIGFLGGLAEARQVLGPEVRLFLFIGVLGGFTTFSTFGYETFALLRDGQTLQAVLNILLQLLLGLGAVWAGYIISRLL
jgi:fluoride exporter